MYLTELKAQYTPDNVTTSFTLKLKHRVFADFNVLTLFPWYSFVNKRHKPMKFIRFPKDHSII